MWPKRTLNGGKEVSWSRAPRPEGQYSDSVFCIPSTQQRKVIKSHYFLPLNLATKCSSGRPIPSLDRMGSLPITSASLTPPVRQTNWEPHQQKEIKEVLFVIGLRCLHHWEILRQGDRIGKRGPLTTEDLLWELWEDSFIIWAPQIYKISWDKWKNRKPLQRNKKYKKNQVEIIESKRSNNQ